MVVVVVMRVIMAIMFTVTKYNVWVQPCEAEL